MKPMTRRIRPLHVTLISTPHTQVAPLSGLYETLTAFPLLSRFEDDLPEHPFDVAVVGARRAPDPPPGGGRAIDIRAARTCDEIQRTDIAIVPLMMVDGPDWVPGRYPGLVEWLRTQHAAGATLASACTGVLLLAETGLLDGLTATIHWAFAPVFRRTFPDVRLRTEEVLITAGDRQEFVMTGGVMSWHDLALHIIAWHVGATAAQAMARFLMLEWHGEGQAPWIGFAPSRDHGDAEIVALQEWIAGHLAVDDPVERMIEWSGLPVRTLERRFRRATGHTPLAYVQNARVAEARRRLERTSDSVERIGYDVGYRNTAFFRRLFRRITRLTPSAYRRKFQIG